MAASTREPELPATRTLVYYVARILLAVWCAAGVDYLLVKSELLAGWMQTTALVAIGVADVAIVLYPKQFRTWLFGIVFGQWRLIDAETEREPGEAGTFSYKLALSLALVAVSLTLQYYIGDRSFFDDMLRKHQSWKYFELASHAWWSGWRVIGYVILPFILIKCLPGERIRDYHLSTRGFLSHAWIYIAMYLCFLPVLIYASTTPAFRHTYPFYRMANRSPFDLWAWEALYAAQFLSLEIFFRGFILKALRRRLGSNAVFVMIVPYCMIHYGKPMPETLGAILAGVLLGTLAMRTKSIWGGVLIHVGVAMTMDVLALRGCPPIGSGHFCGS